MIGTVSMRQGWKVIYDVHIDHTYASVEDSMSRLEMSCTRSALLQVTYHLQISVFNISLPMHNQLFLCLGRCQSI